MKIRLSGAILFCSALLAIEHSSAQTWTQRTPDGLTNIEWTDVASSADGTKLAAIAYYDSSGTPSQIFLSTNSGVTWVKSGAQTNVNWVVVASSADGTKLAATAANAGVYVSTNSGVTWTTTNMPSGFPGWGVVASSADGSKLVAEAMEGEIYVSTNSGTTWQLTINPNMEINRWGSRCSADGTKMAVLDESALLTSTNTGSTWQSSFVSANYTSVEPGVIEDFCSAADGSRLFIFTYAVPTNFYISTNWGVSWSSNILSFVTQNMIFACSADGSRLAAGNGDGTIYVSTDFGSTWVSNSAPNLVVPVAFSVDGSELVGLLYDPFHVNKGGVWIESSIPRPQLNLASSSNGLALSWIVPSTNFVLQENPDLTASNWVILTNTPTLNLSNLNDEVVLSPTNRSGFFRLMSH